MLTPRDIVVQEKLSAVSLVAGQALPSDWGYFIAIFPPNGQEGRVNWVGSGRNPKEGNTQNALNAVLARLRDRDTPTAGKPTDTRQKMDEVGQRIDEEIPAQWLYFALAFPPKGEPDWSTNARRRQLIPLLEQTVKETSA